MKKLLSAFLIFSILFLFASCGEKEESSPFADIDFFDSEIDESSDRMLDNVQGITPNMISPVESFDGTSDPVNWTKQQIIDCYKSAMILTEAEGGQTDLNYELFCEVPAIISGPLKLFLKLKSKPFDGLTGGYRNLTESDIRKAEARVEGEYIIINLYPESQTNGLGVDIREGTVGHLITGIGGIDGFVSFVQKNLGFLKMKYNENSVTMKYTDAFAKNIRINTYTGLVEGGIWGYTFDLYLDDCSFIGHEFNNFHIIIDMKSSYPSVNK